MIIKKYPKFQQFFTKIVLFPISNKKAELFNYFFAKQCSITDKGTDILSFLYPKIDKSLSNITLTERDIEI